MTRNRSRGRQCGVCAGTLLFFLCFAGPSCVKGEGTEDTAGEVTTDTGQDLSDDVAGDVDADEPDTNIDTPETSETVDGDTSDSDVDAGCDGCPGLQGTCIAYGKPCVLEDSLCVVSTCSEDEGKCVEAPRLDGVTCKTNYCDGICQSGSCQTEPNHGCGPFNTVFVTDSKVVVAPTDLATLNAFCQKQADEGGLAFGGTWIAWAPGAASAAALLGGAEGCSARWGLRRSGP